MKFEIGKTQVEVVSSEELIIDLTGKKGTVVGTLPPPPENPSLDPSFKPHRVMVRLENLKEKLNPEAATGGNIINFRPEEIEPIKYGI